MAAAAIAHEINNPLSALLIILELAQSELSNERPVDLELMRELLLEAREATERLRAMVRDMQQVSAGEPAVSGPFEVRGLLEEAVRVAASQVHGRARLILDFGDVRAAWGTRSRLVEVFVNLIVNSAHAIPPGDPERHEIRIRASTADAERICVEVSDTGCGMTPEVASRAFDLFFTTRPPGCGMGLGLHVCRYIVSHEGGRIDFASEPGRGTTVRVLLRADPPGP